MQEVITRIQAIHHNTQTDEDEEDDPMLTAEVVDSIKEEEAEMVEIQDQCARSVAR